MSKKDESPDDKSIIPEIIQTGYEVGGNVGSAIIGGLLAGPAGIVIGAASGPILTKLFTKVGAELKERYLGNREESRVGFTYATGYHKLKSRLEAGDELREDDFFELNETNRSPAEEILEGVLRSAQTEHQEKKLKYYGNLIANLSFDTSVNENKANLFLKIANNLTYKQLCILQFLIRNGQQRLAWNYNFNHLEELQDYSDLEPFVLELERDKLLSAVWGSGNVLRIISIGKLGSKLAELMSLNEIGKDDIDEIESEFAKVHEIILSKDDNSNKSPLPDLP